MLLYVAKLESFQLGVVELFLDENSQTKIWADKEYGLSKPEELSFQTFNV